MTKQFLVYSNDASFGVFEAEDEQGAIDACAREAGYESERDMVRRLNEASTLIAKPAEEAKAFFKMVDGFEDC